MRHNPRILIVEDSMAVQALLDAVLTAAGYTDLVFRNSVEEALDWVAGADRVPDLVLTDVILPGKDGIEGLRILKETPAFFEVPFIVMTSDDSDEVVDRAFSQGALDFVRKPFRQVELMARIGSALRLRSERMRRHERERELLDLIEQVQLANLDLGLQSRIDYLTALANRVALDEYLARVWEEHKSRGVMLGLLMIDLDYFKAFNDTYGHAAGDDCLKKTAGVMDSCLNRPADLSARYGGEEFTLVLPGTGEFGLRVVAERVRRRVFRLGIVHAQSPETVVTLSLGGSAEIPASGRSWKDLIARADEALYQAKQQGRNRYCYLPAV
jgi:diguanylate cyclase (GGDEF)-like protein